MSCGGMLGHALVLYSGLIIGVGNQSFRLSRSIHLSSLGRGALFRSTVVR